MRSASLMLSCVLLLILSCKGDDEDTDDTPPPSGACYDQASIAAESFIECMFTAIADGCALFDVPPRSDYAQGRVYLADAIADGTVTYAADKAPACLRAMKAEGCELIDARAFISDDAACQQAVVGTVASGGDCVYEWECSTRRCTSNDGATCGSCYAPVAADGTCSPHPTNVLQQTCADGLYCDPTSSQCKPLVATVGAACAAAPSASGQSQSCAADLICAPDAPGSATWECQAPVASGQACPLVSRMRCAEGLACNAQSQTCEPIVQVAIGAACDAGHRCPSDARCLFPFDDPNATSPECVAIQTVTTGQSCDDIVRLCGEADYCGSSGSGGQTCRARPIRGDNCTAPVCAGELRCLGATDKCGDAIALGGVCVDDLDCESGFCNGTCATARDICG